MSFTVTLLIRQLIRNFQIKFLSIQIDLQSHLHLMQRKQEPLHISLKLQQMEVKYFGVNKKHLNHSVDQNQPE